jgi:hypothetical protein
LYFKSLFVFQKSVVELLGLRISHLVTFLAF